MPLELTENYIARRLKEAYQPGVVASTDGYAALATSQSGEKLTWAAVLMPLAWKEDEWHLLFTRRTNDVEHHKGQVSFPGGACEADETAEQTALREAEEEIGLQQADVRILGQLNDVVTITHYRVTPLVGVIPWPYEFYLAKIEVSRVFTIPLQWLMQRENWAEHNFTPEGTQRAFPVISYHPYDGEILWGASARMTQNLLAVLHLQ
ncbi:MAG: CoA pyrophosphatase [Chloroflexi bacterium]|nr:CoA pyrophosphatase [Chloroflexota bacterium]